MIKARQIGLSRDEFWDLTFRDLVQEFVVARRQAYESHDRDMTNAWTVAALMRQKELPKLDKLLVRPRRRRQSVKEQRAAMYSLAASMGVSVKRVRIIHKDINGR